MAPNQYIALLKIVGLTSLCAFLIMKAHKLIRHESGLTSTDTLRQVWSKTEQIIFQPIAYPAIYSIVVGLGLKSVIADAALTVLQVLDLIGPVSRMGGILITGFSQAISTLAAVFLYRNCDGRNPKPFLGVYVALAAVLFILQIMTLGEPNMPDNHEGPGNGSPQPPGTELHGLSYWTVRVVLDILASLLCGFWALGQSSAPRFGDSASIQGTTATRFPYLHLAGWALPLIVAALFNFETVVHYGNKTPAHYLSRIVIRFSDMTVILMGAFAGMWSTHRRIMNGCYSWHWQSVLLTGIPITLAALLRFVYQLLRPNEALLSSVSQLLKCVFVGATSGFVGAVTFLAIVARYAQIALNGNASGESDLVIEDDSDSDLNEYEV